MRSGNRAETPSVFAPWKRKVLTKDSRGNVRSPRHDYRILAAALFDRVYTDVDSPFHVPVFLVAKGETSMTSFHLRVTFRKEKRCALFNVVLVFFVTRSESLSRILGGVSLALHSHLWIMHRWDIMFNISRIRWINWNCMGGWNDALNLCNIILSIFHLITDCVIIW